MFLDLLKKHGFFVLKKDGFLKKHGFFVLKKDGFFYYGKSTGFLFLDLLKKHGFFEKTRVFCTKKGRLFLLWKKHGFFVLRLTKKARVFCTKKGRFFEKTRVFCTKKGRLFLLWKKVRGFLVIRVVILKGEGTRRFHAEWCAYGVVTVVPRRNLTRRKIGKTPPYLSGHAPDLSPTQRHTRVTRRLLGQLLVRGNDVILGLHVVFVDSSWCVGMTSS